MMGHALLAAGCCGSYYNAWFGGCCGSCGFAKFKDQNLEWVTPPRIHTQLEMEQAAPLPALQPTPVPTAQPATANKVFA